jgi:hypothetical protein
VKKRIGISQVFENETGEVFDGREARLFQHRLISHRVLSIIVPLPDKEGRRLQYSGMSQGDNFPESSRDGKGSFSRVVGVSDTNYRFNLA